jgi:tetratricopeptide (TPR) repeat protein
VSLERIEITPFAVIAGEILQNRKSGYLTLLKPPLRKVLYWSQGELVMAASGDPADSLGDFLVRKGAVPPDRAQQLFGEDANDVVARVHESGLLDLSTRQTLLREWLTAQFLPLFSLDEGTTAFTDDDPLPPDKRIFLQSTAALLVEGLRSITNGLVLRRSLGDLKREIQLARNSRFSIESLPLTEQERTIAASLTEPASIETFLKRSPQSVAVAKVVIAMLALGVYTIVEERAAASSADFADMQRDLELLAAIGSSDQRSLRAVALSRQLPSLDHYQVLDVPRAATRAQVINAAEEMKKRYDPSSFPPVVRESVTMILRRVDEAADVLKDAVRRGAYDKLIHSRGTGEGAASLQQRLTQRSIAEQNYARAKELTVQGDYYGAIVLLKQTVNYAPDHADAWHLLGSCQERNPKWRRDAAESFQMALSIDPNNVEALISLGDLYKSEGMISRAQTCYEDVLKISAENQQAKSRLQGLKKR